MVVSVGEAKRDRETGGERAPYASVCGGERLAALKRGKGQREGKPCLDHLPSPTSTLSYPVKSQEESRGEHTVAL